MYWQRGEFQRNVFESSAVIERFLVGRSELLRNGGDGLVRAFTTEDVRSTTEHETGRGDQIPFAIGDQSASTLFQSAILRLEAFGASTPAGGWTSAQVNPRQLADVNGDGMADIVGFGNAGVYVSLATGGGAFAAPTFTVAFFGAAQSGGGWSSADAFPRQLADVNGDGRADIVGFGNAGVYVSLGTAGGSFTSPTLVLGQFGAAPSSGGWSSDNTFLRQLADVNGDGRADIVGFGASGVYVSLGTAGGSFAAPTLSLNAFGYAASAGGWESNERYPRMLADVNGDGMADIVGFGEAGVLVALATGGGNFANPVLTMNAFGAGASAGGWASLDRYPRMLADVNGDGRADILGFGEGGVYVSYARSTPGTFDPSVLLITEFGATAGGWYSNNVFPRDVADVNGDGLADIVGFGNAGTYVSLSTLNAPTAYVVTESTANNNTMGTAVMLDRSRFSVLDNPNLENDALPSGRIVGSLTAGDHDYYGISLNAGELLIVDVDGTTGIDAVITVYDAQGNVVAENDDGGVLDPGSNTQLDSLFSFRASTPGTYYVVIEDYEGTETGNYSINLSIGPPATSEELIQENVEALISGWAWSTLNLTYAFPTSIGQYGGDGADEGATFQPLLSQQQTAVRTMLHYIAGLTNLTFTEVAGTPGSAMLRFARSDAPDTAWAYYPGSGDGGDSWYNISNGDYDNPIIGNYAWATFLHETGHALGLKHGHESPAIDPTHNSLEYSIMTYNSHLNDSSDGYTNEEFGYPTTFMMYDIAALQQLYGADFGTNSGNSVYTWNPTTGAFMINGVVQWTPGGNRVFMTIWDGGGIDTYDFSNYNYGSLADGVTIDLRPGAWNHMSDTQIAYLGEGYHAVGNVANALLYNDDARSLIENAIGTGGRDNITGNDAVNVLTGNGGADTFHFLSVSQSTTTAADTITDFRSGDKLNLSLIDANTNTSAEDAFTFLGTGAFTGVAGQLRYVQVGSDIQVLGDVNGDGVADFQVTLLGYTALNINDIVP